MEQPRRTANGLVIIYTGDGKGKTTSALGTLFRAWGRNMRVGMFQFIKQSTANFGEHRAAHKIGVELTPVGDGFTWRSKDMDATIALALQQWEFCKQKLVSNEYDLVIFDELTYLLHFGWLAVEEVKEALRMRPKELHVIITGRYAPIELIEFADLVTEMKAIKHPFDRGIKAQPGIDF